MALASKDLLKLLCKDHTVREELCHIKTIATADGEEKISTKSLVQTLRRECYSTGLKKLLGCLPRNELKIFAKNVTFEDDKIPSAKTVLVKRIHDQMDKDPKKFLSNIESSELKHVIKLLDLEIPSSPKDYVETLLQEADAMGMENLLSSVSEKNLQLIVEVCGLRVDSASRDLLIDCIMKQVNHKAKKKKKVKPEKISKKKPPIKNGISKADLQNHYYRDELSEYCKEHELNTSGNKKDFIQRILAHVEGREQPKPLKKGKKRVKKRKASSTDDDNDSESAEAKPSKKTKKSDDKSSEKSDKSEKTEKSEMDDTEDEDKKEKPKKNESKPTTTSAEKREAAAEQSKKEKKSDKGGGGGPSVLEKEENKKEKKSDKGSSVLEKEENINNNKNKSKKDNTGSE